jgi:NodT family efflux transporter outer membrane factor (OMF) lipoprotein
MCFFAIEQLTQVAADRTLNTMLLRNIHRSLLTAVLSLVLLAGCASLGEEPITDEQAPTKMPNEWMGATTVLPGEPRAWLDDFDSPTLTELVEEAVEGNFDLAAASARVDAAKARSTIAGADRIPQLDLQLSAQRNNTLLESGGDTIEITRNRFALEGGISWEADIWGRLSNRARAAVADANAASADYRAARLSLAAQVTRAWFSAIEANQQLRLSELVVDYFKQSLEVTESRYRRGIGSSLDVRLSRANVAGAEADLAQRRRELDAALRDLDTLLGRYPKGKEALPEELPELLREVPAGLPSELLARRPDLIAARERLLASSERAREANKNMLPGLTLTGSAGSASDDFKDVLDFDSLVWSLFAGLTQPIFQGGRLKAQRVLAGADNREAWALYAQTVLDAFREVETTLAAESLFAEQEAALSRAAKESLDAAEQALDQYGQGLIDIITLLESQRRAVTAESSRLLIARLRLTNRVNLYLALGGSFDNEMPPDTQQTARAETP